MKSNIKHFTRKSLWFFMISMLYGAFMGFLSYDGEGGELVVWFLIGAAAMNLGSQVAILKSEVPLVLSFGSTRNNLFLGVVWYGLMNVCLGAIGLLVVTIILNPGWSPVFMALMSAGVLIIAQILGTLVGIVIYKFKGIAAFLIIFIAAILISGGITMGVIVFREEIADLTAKGITGAGPYVVAAVVLLVWGLVLWMQKRQIYKYSL